MNEIILGILFATVLIIYCIYKRRLNDFLLYKIDYLVVFIILVIGFKISISNVIDRNDLILFFTIFAFFVGFLQYRKNKEYEVLDNYFRDSNDIKALKNLILNLKILLPIVGQNRNIINIILGHIVKEISEDKINSDNILEIFHALGGYGKVFLSLLKQIKRLEENEIKKIKLVGGIAEKRKYLDKLDNIILGIEEKLDKYYHQETRIDKTINFFKP